MAKKAEPARAGKFHVIIARDGRFVAAEIDHVSERMLDAMRLALDAGFITGAGRFRHVEDIATVFADDSAVAVDMISGVAVEIGQTDLASASLQDASLRQEGEGHKG